MVPFTAIALCALLLSSKMALAQQSDSPLPRTLSYQGVLMPSGGGIKAAGSRLLTVTLYGDANGTIKLWQSTMNTTVDSSGVFNCLLGTADNPLPDPSAMDRPIWLGVAVDNGPELRPLSQVTASAYALNVVDNAITTAKLADNAVTTAKIADSSITANKVNMDYIGSISVNGQKATGIGSAINIASAGTLPVYFDSASSTILLGNPPSDFIGSQSGLTVTNTDDGTYGGSDASSTNAVVGGQHNEAWNKWAATPETAGLDFVGGGFANKSWGHYDAIPGGDTNVIVSDMSQIGGGNGNRIDTVQNYSVIGGGQNNAITNKIVGNAKNEGTNWHVIGGGYGNTIAIDVEAGNPSENHVMGAEAILGGESNTLDGPWGFMGGGENNMIANELPLQDDDAGDRMTYDAIVGGQQNSIDTLSAQSFIGGGLGNHIAGMGTYGGPNTHTFYDSAFANRSVIGGGEYNGIFSANDAAITGGDTNTILRGADYSAIGGGRQNTIQSPNSVIAGGEANFASATHTTVGGGVDNRAEAEEAMVGGGELNVDSGSHAVIAGGYSNTAKGNYSSILGGASNDAAGVYSSILGGRALELGDSSVGYNAGGSSNVTNLTSFKNVGYLGNVDLWIGNVDNTARALRLYSPNTSINYSSSHYSSFQAGGQTSNIIYTLPVSGPVANGQVLGVSTFTGPNVSLAWISPDTGHGGGGLFWSLTGNANTVAGSNFIGTTDSAAFEIHVLDTATSSGGNKRVMRYTFGSTSPNILGGSSANTLAAGLSGAAILSGGSLVEPNTIRDSARYSVIGGGAGNNIGGPFSVIGGGENNMDLADSADHNVIGGGLQNTEIDPSYGTIGGGAFNYLDSASWGSTIAGGYKDTVQPGVSFLGGGQENTIDTNWGFGDVLVGGRRNHMEHGADAFIGGGYANHTSGSSDVLAGGDSNVVFSTFASLGGGLRDTISSDYAFLGGGQSNKIDVNSDHSVLAGGDSNIVQSNFSTLGGGLGNKIGVNSAHSVLAGGSNDTVFASNSVLAGGDSNVIRQNASGSIIGGGTGNLVDSNSLFSTISGGYTDTIDNGVGSTISGGQNNIIHTQDAVIGGGVLNFIAHSDCPCGSTIGGGLSDSIVGLYPRWSNIPDSIPPFMCTIAGGEQNTANAIGASIGGGLDNHVLGAYGTIPGGSQLIAFYQQTVIGYVNDTSGSEHGGEFVVGNGTFGHIRSNAFSVSDSGHSVVYQTLGNAIPGYGSTIPIYGGAYQDNGIIAWGDVPSDFGLAGPGHQIMPVPTPDVGIVAVFHPHGGEYIICLQARDADGNYQTLTNASITATLEDNNTNIDDSTTTCGTITVSKLGVTFVGQPPSTNCFIVRTTITSGDVLCTPVDRPFQFKVCARP